jgi:hypothetical protein
MLDVDYNTPTGKARATSCYSRVEVYRPTRDRYDREWRYTAALMHGPYFESYIVLTHACRQNHRTHEAAMRCAMRIAKREGVEVEELQCN